MASYPDFEPLLALSDELQDPPPPIPPQTVTIPLSTLEKAKRAADEAAASRVLIAAQEEEITALKTALSLENKKVSLLESIINARGEQMVQKDIIISSLEKSNGLLLARNTKLEKSNSKLRKIGTILGAIAGGLLFVVIH